LKHATEVQVPDEGGGEENYRDSDCQCYNNLSFHFSPPVLFFPFLTVTIIVTLPVGADFRLQTDSITLETPNFRPLDFSVLAYQRVLSISKSAYGELRLLKIK
jgi:hypothetical protein